MPQKGDNVFLVGNSTRLADFGLASAGRAAGRAGALPFESPEQAQGAVYDGKNDVWALGCMMTELLTLRTLTDRVGANQVFAMQFPVVRETLDECTRRSPQLGGIVTQMLNFRAEHRPTAEQVVALLAPHMATFQAMMGAGALAAGSGSGAGAGAGAPVAPRAVAAPGAAAAYTASPLAVPTTMAAGTSVDLAGVPAAVRHVPVSGTGSRAAVPHTAYAVQPVPSSAPPIRVGGHPASAHPMAAAHVALPAGVAMPGTAHAPPPGYTAVTGSDGRVYFTPA